MTEAAIDQMVLIDLGKTPKPGTHPIEILQRKFTLRYFFKHFDWVL